MAQIETNKTEVDNVADKDTEKRIRALRNVDLSLYLNFFINV